MSETTNVYLENKCNELHISVIVCDITSLTELISGQNYILNLGNNSHWVGLACLDNSIYYFDSFGVPPPIRIMDLIKKLVCKTSKPIGYHYNTIQIQNLQSGYCGLYSLLFLYFMNRSKGTTTSRFKRFQNLFDEDVEKNKTILVEKLHKIGFYN